MERVSTWKIKFYDITDGYVQSMYADLSRSIDMSDFEYLELGLFGVLWKKL